jgi:hypothetical protein
MVARLTTSREPAQSSETIRETTKWLTTAFAGVAAVLVAGLQLRDLAQLHESVGRLLLALIGLVAALLSVGWIIVLSSDVLTSRYLTFDQLINQWLRAQQEAVRQAGRGAKRREPLPAWLYDPLIKELQDDWQSLVQNAADDLGDLHRKRREAFEAVANLRQRSPHEGREGGVDPTTLEERALYYEQLTERVVDYANEYTIGQAFRRFRSDSLWAGSIVVLGVILYAWSVNAPDKVTIKVASPMPVSIVLTSDGQAKLASVLGKNCVAKPIKAMAIGGQFPSPEVVVLPSAACQSRRLRITDELGATIPDVPPSTGAPAGSRTTRT